MDVFELARNIGQDLRYGARQLRSNPGFTLVAVLSLALGIGANTAIFQLIDAVRLRTLPVEKPEELVTVDFRKGSTRSGWFSGRSSRFTHGLWDRIRAEQQAFTGMAAWSATRFNLAPGGEIRNAEGLYVNGDFFRVLGVPAIAGRTFVADDDRVDCSSPGAVISHAFWQREFGGDAGVIGRNVSVEGRPFPVIGVTPASFFGVEVGQRFDIALPMCADKLLADDGKGRMPVDYAWWIAAMGRLRPGWTVERANAHIEAISPALMRATLPRSYRAEEAKKYQENKLEVAAAGTGVSEIRRRSGPMLWILLGTTGLVLLIACANLANLLLARATVREREIAVRQAIGAGRGRLIAQLLAESLLLAVLGGVAGIVLAQFLSDAMVGFLTTPGNLLFLGLTMNWRVLGFTAALAAGTSVLFGLLPALRATRIEPVSVMRAGGRGLTAGPERFGLRRVLVAAQIALSMMLLAGALLFARSLGNLLAVDAGFRPDGLLTARIDLSRAKYAKQRLPVVYDDLLQRLSTRPGVVSAAQVLLAPVSGGGWNQNAFTSSPAEKKLVYFNRVGPGYFHTMGTGFLAGRDFDRRDSLASPKVAILNEAFAAKLFGGANPVGKTFRVEEDAGKPDSVYEIVGLVKNTKYYELREDFLPIAFFAMSQEADPGSHATFVLRTSGPLGDVFHGVKQVVAELHPDLALEFRVMSKHLKDSLTRERLMATLTSAFGVLAAFLAMLGLYGVIAYMVERRRNEIGVRIALGAGRGSVIGLVMRESVGMIAVGLVVGIALAVGAARAAEAMLYGLKPWDPLTLAGAAGLLSVVALLAAYGPARKASLLEPVEALREE